GRTVPGAVVHGDRFVRRRVLVDRDGEGVRNRGIADFGFGHGSDIGGDGRARRDVIDRSDGTRGVVHEGDGVVVAAVAVADGTGRSQRLARADVRVVIGFNEIGGVSGHHGPRDGRY